MDMDLWTTLLGEVQESWMQSIRGLDQVHDSMSKEIQSMSRIVQVRFSLLVDLTWTILDNIFESILCVIANAHVIIVALCIVI